MSAEKQKVVEEIKQGTEKLNRDAEHLFKKSDGLGDKHLSEKLHKIKQGTEEVVKHIKERQES